MSDLHLAETIAEALRIREVMRAAGDSEETCAAALEHTIRLTWPFTREWKYLCDLCNDTGLHMHECSGDARCGRTNLHMPHRYGVACWCDKGKPFRPKTQTPDDDARAVGKTKKPSRFGR